MKNRYVYFIREVLGELSPVKIGVARNVERRLCALQIGNMRRLEVVAKIGPMSKEQAYRVERDLHIKFRKHRLRGEWFTGVVLKRLHQISDPVETV